jgi:small subunit ribosomal protein S13
MPRIAGIDIPEHKKALMSLQSIYGVGEHTAKNVLKQANVDPDKRTRELTGDEVNRIQKVLDGVNVEGSLRRMINDNIQRLKRIKSYRGMRHAAGLPTRGQRTKTNSRNSRGGVKRRTVGAMTKEMAAKLDAAKTKK